MRGGGEPNMEFQITVNTIHIMIHFSSIISGEFRVIGTLFPSHLITQSLWCHMILQKSF